jgi:membrane associated rhomboid family serine protease
MTPTIPAPRRRRKSRPWFAAFAVLAVLGVFVLGSPLGGIATFCAFAAFLVGLMAAVAGEDVRDAERLNIGLSAGS